MDQSTQSTPSVQPQLQLFDPQGEPLSSPPFPLRLRVLVPVPCEIEIVLTPHDPVRYARFVPQTLSPLDQRILHALRQADRPLKGAVVCVRIKATCANSCRRQLSSLVKRGLIEKVKGGYQVAKPPQPCA